jgi:hypothetical protein
VIDDANVGARFWLLAVQFRHSVGLIATARHFTFGL